MLDFAEVKKIKIIEVAARYGIQFRYRGDWASAPCPLPIHKEGDKGRNFTVNVSGNFWRCYSDSCNAKNGGRKGGDVINFVAVMENCGEHSAAQKLAEWFSLNGNKNPAPRKTRADEGNVPPSPHVREDTSPAVAGKSGYLQETRVRIEALLTIVPEEFRAQTAKAVMDEIYKSWKNGKTASKL